MCIRDSYNSGEKNSVLEYAVFTSTEPAGVEIDNEKGYISVNDSKTAVVYINPDYLEEGTNSFDVIVNSNGQPGESSQTYKVIINKYYQTWYQDWTVPEEKPTVMTKPMMLTRYTYTGREYNRETGQYYYRARTYVSRIGRFTGKDSSGYPGYKYVGNNPNKYYDPTGLIAIQFKIGASNLKVFPKFAGIGGTMVFTLGTKGEGNKCFDISVESAKYDDSGVFEIVLGAEYDAIDIKINVSPNNVDDLTDNAGVIDQVTQCGPIDPFVGVEFEGNYYRLSGAVSFGVGLSIGVGIMPGSLIEVCTQSITP